ncbi:sigma-70 family RNA polymerase sigma factor [Bacillus sp. JJ1609]|uniref:RNA polymerase sigma factor n=1 Tax=Bacillus sp. JJ1609 TaxID=3122977 RepID=UPI002FFF7D30
MRNSPDGVLYVSIQAKNKEALETLYDRYEKILFSFLYKMTQDYDLAEEALQEVFLKIWKGTGEYDESKGKFTSWLFTMARNSAIDIIRKKKVKPSVPIDDINHMVSDDQSVEEKAEWHEEKVRVQEAVSKLSDDQRGMIQLMYFKGYTQQKISEDYNIPLGTVKSRIRLALKNLKKSLVFEHERRG